MEGEEEGTGVIITGRRFCAPYPIELTVQKKALGCFIITDSNGIIVLKAIGLHDRRVLQEPNGNVLLTMRKKTISMHRRWDAFKGDQIQKIVFTVKKSSIFQLKTAVAAFLASNTDENQCDFQVEGNYFHRRCTIFQGDRVVAEMKRKYTAENVLVEKNTFAVVVLPGTDCAFVVSLLIIADEICGNNQ